MTDLAGFLLARNAEDQADAVAAQAQTPDPTAGWEAYPIAAGEDEVARHVKRWHPTRVLAECDAKRRIVQDAINDVRDARRRPGWTIPDSELDELGRRYRAGVEHQKAQQLPHALDRTERLLRLLALPYADHPDYRAEWRP